MLLQKMNTLTLFLSQFLRFVPTVGEGKYCTFGLENLFLSEDFFRKFLFPRVLQWCMELLVRVDMVCQDVIQEETKNAEKSERNSISSSTQRRS